MNVRLKIIVTHSLSFVLGLTAFAQGNGFTYQGRLNDGANPANGTYDLRFALYDAATAGTQQGAGLTNFATPVSNGAFTVTLDFGNQFPGGNRWLELGVRTNGGASFFTLSPRQAVTPTPYAMFAGNAATVTGPVLAGQITGTVSPAVLPPGVVTNGAAGVSISGTFTGNGAGLINVPGALPLQVVAGPSVSAQPNAAYDANSAARMDVNLPTNANIGDTVRVSGLGAGGWQFLPGPGQVIAGIPPVQLWSARGNIGYWRAVASSADGSRLFAVQAPGQVNISTNGGANWIARPDYRNWVSIAASADGTKLVAVVIGGQIYTSADGGTTWIARESNRSWIWVASSATGNKLVAVVNGGQIYTSADSGTNWIARGSTNNWWSVASSADGTKLVAAASGGQIYTSTDSGTNWVARESARGWSAVTSSADGTKLAAVADYIYTSTDGGTNWIARENVRSWNAVAASADGTKIIATVQNGQIYTSSDGGTNWIASETNRNWYVVASSADGNKLVAGVNGGDLFTSLLTTPLGGSPGASLELQYAGNGVWQQLNRFDAGNIFSGTLADARLSANVALLSANQTFTGQNSLNNAANSFAGDGSGLTGISATGVTSGTLADARLSGNVALLNASQTFFGPNNFNNAANNFTGSGAGLTSLNAAELASGTLADARLSANVALRGGGNFFTGNQSIAGALGIGTASPQGSLHVYSDNNPTVMRLQSSGTPGFGRLEFVSNPQGDINEWRPGYIQSTDSGNFSGGLAFFVNGTGAASKFGSTEVMRVVNGAVGIGTANPVTPLHVKSVSPDCEISVESPDTYNPAGPAGSPPTPGRRWTIQSSSPIASGQLAASFQIIDRTAGASRLLIDTSGECGIGTTSPDSLLTVNGAASKPGGGSWNTYSDGRLKDVERDFTPGLSALEQIQPVQYHYKVNNVLTLPSAPEYVGVVAQQLQQALPEAVQTNATGYLTVNNDPVIWTTVNAVKELNRKLETENAALNARLERLEKLLGERQ